MKTIPVVRQKGLLRATELLAVDHLGCEVQHAYRNPWIGLVPLRTATAGSDWEFGSQVNSLSSSMFLRPFIAMWAPLGSTTAMRWVFLIEVKRHLYDYQDTSYSLQLFYFCMLISLRPSVVV